MVYLAQGGPYMPWKESTIMIQKEAFIKQVLERKNTFSSICEAFQISRTTGYSILKKFKCEGLQGLVSVSRAPFKSPNKTTSSIENKILSVREKHTTWGARKILVYLQNKQIASLPSLSTISEILKRNGCITKEASLKSKELIRFEREQSNDLWQMDFKGQFKLWMRESCYPLTILDDYSRFFLCLQGCRNEDIIPVKKQLIITFKQYGLPKQINVDNGRPWGNSCIVKHTALTVWLLRLDILVTHSRPRHPQTNGKLERFHRTFKEDVLQKQKIKSFTHTQRLFNQWRRSYNYERPHEGINMLVPADRYQISTREMPSKLRSIEYNKDSIIRKVNTRGIISFGGKDYVVGKAFSGYHLELQPDEANAELKIYLNQHKIQTSDLG